MQLEGYKNKGEIMKKENEYCPMCYEEVKIEDLITLECDHISCKPCLTDYIRDKVNNG